MFRLASELRVYVCSICCIAFLFYENKWDDASKLCADKLPEKIHQEASRMSIQVTTKRRMLPELILSVPLALKSRMKRLQYVKFTGISGTVENGETFNDSLFSLVFLPGMLLVCNTWQ